MYRYNTFCTSVYLFVWVILLFIFFSWLQCLMYDSKWWVSLIWALTKEVNSEREMRSTSNEGPTTNKTTNCRSSDRESSSWRSNPMPPKNRRVCTSFLTKENWELYVAGITPCQILLRCKKVSIARPLILRTLRSSQKWFRWSKATYNLGASGMSILINTLNILSLFVIHLIITECSMMPYVFGYSLFLYVITRLSS